MQVNIYEKLQNVRVQLQNKNLKKSGNNKFAGYTYYELCDFLPTINQLLLENKMSSYINFNNETATLTIINAENPEEKIEFTSPMSEASLKGCHNIQNLGAVQTYLRRYLYMNAFEIVEADMLDGTTGEKEDNNNEVQQSKPATQKSRKLTDKQINRLMAIASKAGKTDADIKEYIKHKWGLEHKVDMTKEQYDEICNKLEALTKKEAG